MKLQAKVLGVQAEDSHSDLDDEPEEDEEDE
jgi:hypothetical protein